MLVIWIPAVLFGGMLLWFLGVGRLVLFYFVGWYGMRQTIVFLPLMQYSNLIHIEQPESKLPNASEHSIQSQNITSSDSTDTLPLQVFAATNADEGLAQDLANPDKYLRSGMTDAAQQLIGERLVRRMSFERDYLDSEVKLTDLAEGIGTSPQLLSQYLNHVLGLNFFDYINGFRVAEVQRMMADSTNTKLTLLELAFAAGFNSKSTFNASFKKVTGMAPSSWRNKLITTSAPIG
jgi:AraC-like DNA-binding protein